MALGQNDTEYDKYKTPFVNIKIGDAKGHKMIPLPESVARLLEKIEITEVLEGCTHTHTISMTFLEGSREPFQHSAKQDTNNLYSDTHITNHTGMLADIRFSNTDKGLTSVLAAKVGLVEILDVSTLADGTASTSKDKSKITGNTKKPGPINFLFEERNQIQIEWGYRENLTKTRVIRTFIQIVQSNFPEADHPSITIICNPISSMFDQISPPEGIAFQTKIPAGFDPEKGLLYSFKDMSIKELLESVAKVTGLRVIVSDDLINTTADKYHTKRWPKGKSFNQFLKKLASESNANYITITDPNTGDNYIVLISRTDFEKNKIIDDKLFVYRGQGSILKSVSIKAEFSGMSGNTATGYDSDGNKQTVGTTDTALGLFQPSKETGIDLDPTSHNSPRGVSELNKHVAKNSGGVISHGEVSPEMDEPQGAYEKTISIEACRRKQVMLDFTSLGYTNLRPGRVRFSGIGSRYSGSYNIIALVHTIDNNGYNCRGSASSWTLSDSYGASPSNAPKETESTTVDIGLFESKFKTVTDAGNVGRLLGVTEEDASSRLNKLQLGK